MTTTKPGANAAGRKALGGRGLGFDEDFDVKRPWGNRSRPR